MKAIEELVNLLTRLPGIGRKSALRVAWHLLRTDSAYADILAECIRSLRETVRFCSICGSYTEADPCPVCSSHSR
ncbi:MAG: recombination protein RecR, partial [Spirochaetota bacterium]